MKNYLGFVLGIVVGCIALLAVQAVLKAPDVEEIEPPVVEKRTFNPNRDAQQLADAQQRITKLEAQLEQQKSGAPAVAENGRNSGAESKAEGGENKAASFLEKMMSLGENEAERKMNAEVARIAGELGLSENQQSVLKEALTQREEAQKAAGILLMTGQASIDDLMKSDKDDFTDVDRALEAVLDEEQSLAYEAVKEAREVERIQKKTDEELGNLAKAAELTDEQQDAAWQVLADIYATEKPGQIPEGTTTEEFTGIIDDALANRVNGLAPILSEEQLEVYEGQAADFRKLINTLIGVTGE